MSPATIRAPACAQRTAAAWPIPEPAPVITITLSSSISQILFLCDFKCGTISERHCRPDAGSTAWIGPLHQRILVETHRKKARNGRSVGIQHFGIDRSFKTQHGAAVAGMEFDGVERSVCYAAQIWIGRQAKIAQRVIV